MCFRASQGPFKADAATTPPAPLRSLTKPSKPQTLSTPRKLCSTARRFHKGAFTRHTPPSTSMRPRTTAPQFSQMWPAPTHTLTTLIAFRVAYQPPPTLPPLGRHPAHLAPITLRRIPYHARHLVGATEARPREAARPHSIPIDLARAAADIMTPHYRNLLTKIIVVGREPIAFCDTFAVPIPKDPIATMPSTHRLDANAHRQRHTLRTHHL